MTNEPSDLESGGTPLFLVIAHGLEVGILDGSLPEGAQVPSTNELAVFHRINPATAAKGVAQLVADGIIFKRRGIGMFVADGARARLLARREQHFVERFVAPLVAEADLLGLGRQRVLELVGTRLGAAGKDRSWTPSH
ncbi:MAG: GntR family transcriptional regulator [Dermatophilaceae bacterium]